MESLDSIKLVLFTSDNKADTRQRALQAGADEVIVKSPDASEIIKAVIQILDTKPLVNQAPELSEASQGEGEVITEDQEKIDTTPVIDINKALAALDEDRELLIECFEDFLDTYPSMLSDIDSLSRRHCFCYYLFLILYQ